MARLRRSKLAAGFLLLFQCLSERCQLAGGETPRQSRGKRGRYLPGPGRGRAGSGRGRAPPQPRGAGSAGREPGEGERRPGLAPPPPERGPGSRLPILPYHERPLYDFISYFNENSGLSSFNQSAPRSLGAGTVPFPRPLRGVPGASFPATGRRRRAGLLWRAGRGGTGPRSPRERRPDSSPPAFPPAPGPSALPAASRRGMAKFPCRSCLGELAGTLLPRGSQ